jgi:hypothetical protein
MANKEQKGNREKRKPKKEKPKPAPSVAQSNSSSCVSGGGGMPWRKATLETCTSVRFQWVEEGEGRREVARVPGQVVSEGRVLTTAALRGFILLRSGRSCRTSILTLFSASLLNCEA